MQDSAATQAPPSGPTDAQHDWVTDFLDVDPRHYAPPPLPVAALAPAQPAAPKAVGYPAITPYDPATLTSPLPAPPPPAAPLSPEAERANLDRRRAVAGPTYDQLGKAGGDASFAPADRLSAAEMKIGKVVSESGSKITTTQADGSTTTSPIALDGSDSRGVLDERGYTVSTKRSTSTADIGADGKVTEQSIEHSRTQNVGMGNYTETASTKRVNSGEGTTTTQAEQSTASVDLLKGEAAASRTTSLETKDAKGTTKTAETLGATIGLSGATVSQETTKQTGKTFETRGESFGLAAGAGRLGLSSGTTSKSGTKGGTEEAEYTVKGTEQTSKVTTGLVSDDKGTGIGRSAATTTKTTTEAGHSLAGSYSSGGKLQSTVKEVPNSTPPQFKITTTISFDLAMGQTAGHETPKAKPLDASKGEYATVGQEDTKKATASLGVSASVGKSASFSHVMSETEAAAYIEAIKNNGRGSKLPEHRILASGLKDGWDKAAQLWDEIGNNHRAILDMPAGSEIERTTKGSASVKGSLSAGDRNPTGPSLGIEAGRGVTGAITLKLAKLEHGMVKVTASIDRTNDSNWGASAGMSGVSGGHKQAHSDGAGEEVVFLLDGKDEAAFEAQLDQIDACTTAKDLLALTKKPGFNVQERTDKESHNDSESDTLGIGRVSIGLSDQSALSAETKRDAQGNVITSKVTASNEQGASIGTEDVKLAASEAEGLAAEATNNIAKAELSQTSKQSDLGKTLDNIAAAASDPLGAVLNPGKLVGGRADVKAMNLNDDELSALATRALDKSKWDSEVGGKRRDDWLKAATAIRAAITAEGTTVVKIDKTALNRALAEWVKGSDGERVAVIRRLVRPESGPNSGKAQPSGKDIAFPEGTATLKPTWDALMTNDILAAPKALIATKPKDALNQLQDLNAKLNDLRFTLRDLAIKWADAEGQHAEMMGHILTRVHECDQLIATAKSAAKKAAQPAHKPAPPASAKTEAIMRDIAADEAQSEQDPIDLQAYGDNLQQMQTYFDAVFDLIKQAQAKAKERTMFSGAGIEQLKAAGDLMRSARERLALWKSLYDPTYALWEKLSERHDLKKAEMEKLHPHGAQQFYDQVHKEVTG